MRITQVLALIFIVSLLHAATARADELITSIIDGAPFGFPETVTVGYEFQTGANALEVFGLGMWDWQQDGFVNPVTVAIWNVDESLLGSVSIPAGLGGTMVGEFRFVDLDSPITLAANTAYVIGGFRDDGDRYLLNMDPGIDMLIDSNFTIIEQRFSTESQAEIAFPDTSSNPGQAVVGPNVQFNVIPAVPEPASGLVAGMILLLGTFCRRHRHA